MPDELITIFKICFLVLLYLFFFRVLRAVWTEVTAAGVAADPQPAPAPLPVPGAAPKESRRERRRRRTAESSPSGPTALTAVEPPQLAGVEYTLVDGLSIGRGADNGISLEDTFLSTLHATVAQRGGEWFVVDQNSTNGTYLNGVRVEGSAPLQVGDRLQLGGLIVEVR